jgi:uncharacterized membrane protein
MKSMWIALVVCILLLTAAVLHMAWYFPDLPERMASHFDIRGVADGFASKLDVVRVSMMMTFGVTGLLVLVGILIQCCPAALMNFPNKDYWLSPGESRRTRNWSTGHIFWMADATVVFFIGMNQAMFQANLGGPPRLGCGFFAWLGLYCAFMVAWCFLPFWRFRKPAGK